jgi:hypothetical protein
MSVPKTIEMSLSSITRSLESQSDAETRQI